MRHAFVLSLTWLGIAGLAIGAATPQKKGAPAKKKTTQTALRTPGKKPVASAASRSKVRTSKTPVKRTAKTYTPRQLAPSPDRYREIQDALAAKGYPPQSPAGVWDQQSMDALRRFQQDQKLEASGRLTARSLSALGLGPKLPENGQPPSSSSASFSSQMADSATH